MNFLQSKEKFEGILFLKRQKIKYIAMKKIVKILRKAMLENRNSVL